MPTGSSRPYCWEVRNGGGRLHFFATSIFKHPSTAVHNTHSCPAALLTPHHKAPTSLATAPWSLPIALPPTQSSPFPCPPQIIYLPRVASLLGLPQRAAPAAWAAGGSQLRPPPHAGSRAARPAPMPTKSCAASTACGGGSSTQHWCCAAMSGSGGSAHCRLAQVQQTAS